MEVLNKIRGKTILVTGGSRGIGRSISQLFAENGGRIFIVYRSDVESAESCLAGLKGDGHQCFRVDINDPEAIKDLWDEINANSERIDVVINNAGIGFHHPVDQVSYEDWQKGFSDILQTNLIATSNMCYHASQHMIKHGGGKIINISSRGAFRGEPLMPAYGASKAGLNALTQSLAQQLAPYNIYVGAIAPGFVETEMSRPRLKGEVGKAIAAQSPMNRVAQPEEVAEATYLMTCGNMWMTGAIIDVNGASYLRT